MNNKTEHVQTSRKIIATNYIILHTFLESLCSNSALSQQYFYDNIGKRLSLTNASELLNPSGGGFLMKLLFI